MLGSLYWLASTCHVSPYWCSTVRPAYTPGRLWLNSLWIGAHCSAEKSGMTHSLSLASTVCPWSSVHKANDELENPLEMMINSELFRLCTERTYFVLTSEPAGWIAGACPTSCSSSTTHGTPFIPRRLMSNSNSRVSLLPSCRFIFFFSNWSL